ncbi:hypothetical protein OJ998_08655 [Solirubrobacter taibaiensis]|nr:hypothetical protein [Solirubrobacter taibaiensis]
MTTRPLKIFLRSVPLLAVLLALAAPPIAVAGPQGLQWSTPRQIDGAPPYVLRAVSCPSGSFCAATDDAGRVLTSTNPAGAWNSTMVASGKRLNDIDCPTAGLCVAVDDEAHVLTSTNPGGGAATWKRSGVDTLYELVAVSCPSTGFCVAIGAAGHVFTATNPNGGTPAWTRTYLGASDLRSISCASANLCVIGERNGGVRVSTNPLSGTPTWTRAQLDTRVEVGLYGAVNDLACPTDTFCVATDSSRRIHTTTNPTGGAAAWKPTRLTDGSLFPDAISCPTSAFCAGTDGDRSFSSSTPGGNAADWAIRAASTSYLTDIDCISPSLCVSVTGRGEVLLGTPAGPATLTVHTAGSGTVTSSAAGIDCGAACSTTVADGTTVTLTATAAPGSRFVGWSGACAGTASTCQVDVGGAMDVTATFVGSASLTVSKTGTGTVTSTPAGIDCGETCTVTQDQGTKVTLTATAAEGFVFAGWSGACTGAGTCEVTLSEPKTVTASFTRILGAFPFLVDVSGRGRVTSPQGVDCGAFALCEWRVIEGVTHTLTATPEAGARFTGWSGEGCLGTGVCTITVNEVTFVSARFIDLWTLTVAKSGSGTGSVAADVGAIDCGNTCTAVYDNGTQVTLTATPAADSAFVGWEGKECLHLGPCTITVVADRKPTAIFVTKPTLSVTKNGTGTGTVTSAGAGIECGATCTSEIHPGATVTLTAAPAVGSTFTGWSGGGCSGTQPCQVKVDASKSVTATFTVNPQPTATATPTPTPTATATATPPPSPPATQQPTIRPGAQPTPAPTVTAPNTRLLKKTIKAAKRTATFRFSAVGKATGFRCALTARGKKVAYKTCKSPVTFKQLKPGKYTFRVAAIGDPTPATTTITVKKRR